MTAKKSSKPAGKSTTKKATSDLSTALVTTKTAFPTRIELPANTRGTIGAMLNERLADFLDLERQAKQAHWNVKGPRFMQLHELFDATAALAVSWADEIAERAVQLGVAAEGTVQTVAARTKLPVAPERVATADEWVRVVSDALAACANAARENIEQAQDAEDAVTADVLTRIAGAADKQLWFVESHLQK